MPTCSHSVCCRICCTITSDTHWNNSLPERVVLRCLSTRVCLLWCSTRLYLPVHYSDEWRHWLYRNKLPIELSLSQVRVFTLCLNTIHAIEYEISSGFGFWIWIIKNYYSTTIFPINIHYIDGVRCSTDKNKIIRFRRLHIRPIFLCCAGRCRRYDPTTRAHQFRCIVHQ